MRRTFAKRFGIRLMKWLFQDELKLYPPMIREIVLTDRATGYGGTKSRSRER